MSSTTASLSSFSGRSSLQTSPETTPPSSPEPQRQSLKTESTSISLPETLPPVPSNAVISQIDEKDAGTPDAWLNRDPRMVRLTGKHPFNSEAKLDDLFAAVSMMDCKSSQGYDTEEVSTCQGFLTPSELFYVRNHGAVPQINEDEGTNWRVSIEGQVANPLQLSIQDLKDRFQVVTLPVTLVCAGNRRKEQNVVRKGLGFNWGAAGVSTALFTGVYLADILEAAKPIFVDGKRPAHVIFEGADQLPNGPYGTSHLLSWARNKTRGMLIAWAMNGQPLTPDHGYPLRLVSPGNIGGRMVKWLTKIQVSHEESQHYLHFWDNKLLPTQVMPEEARAERKWWYDPRYIINELNTNSAIAKPDHNEGYAYSGGGRRINRVEISIDDGTTWQLAEISYPEDLYRAVIHEDEVYGKLDLTDRDTCFCWCFWSFPIATNDLKDSPAVMVRAMDEGLSGQPRDMYWNATSMMNNWWFRTAIHVEDGNKLRFEHPTMAGTTNGGWMERLKAEGQNVLQPVFGDASDKAIQQVPAPPKPAEHIPEANEPWFVVAGEVYDGTGFLKDHPGRGDSITLVAGEDATEDFMAIHSPQGKAQLAQFHIGTLDLKEILHENKEEVTIDPIFLSKTKWKKATLESLQVVSHDSRVYRFALQAPDQHLGLPTGQHVFCRLRRKVPQDQHGKTEVVEGELVQRAYTPVSPADAKGYIDLLIKLYLPNDKYSMGGKMTSGFNELEVGETMEFKGPLGSFVWQGKGMCTWRGVERKVRKLGMLCGGSGITPILQVLKGVIEDSEDMDTEMWCIDANKTFEDILCREELDSLVKKSNGRFKLHHTLSAVPDGWTGSKGRMTHSMYEKHLPKPSDDALVLICGPEAMINQTAKPLLTELGWDVEKQLVIF
ncbi:hypothetical protein QFC20_001096 [Naganishia adeliensis]|uniref:Uncharacterized protein n=1 Tax=Naganishia adeliensis TaxID=92952 RepID=A0ACC2WVQ7_9TREE|nr:hypothetical protein QFC20_001096 [Naganishia adeliensis]